LVGNMLAALWHALLFNIKVALDVFFQVRQLRVLWRQQLHLTQVSFQKFWMGHLGALDDVGGPAEGLTVMVTGPTRLVRRGFAWLRVLSQLCDRACL
jgi:hypothetical protein